MKQTKFQLNTKKSLQITKVHVDQSECQSFAIASVEQEELLVSDSFYTKIETKSPKNDKMSRLITEQSEFFNMEIDQSIHIF